MPNAEIFTLDNPCVSNPQRGLLTNVVVLLTFALICLKVVAPCVCTAQEQPSRTAWKTGVELDRQLNLAASVRWGNGTELRPALMNLAQFQGVAVFLDRRVDPNKKIEFSVTQSEMSLWDLLQKFADSLQLGVSRIGPTVYLGPPSTARVLATVAALRSDEVSTLPVAAQRQLQRATSLEWPELAMPRQLVQQVGESHGIQVEGLEGISHDLWPAVDLPRMTFVQQMTLLLAGFDLTFTFQDGGQRIKLVPLPDRAVVQRDYALRSSTSEIVDELRRQLPNARFALRSGRLLAEATVEEHESIRRLVSGRPAAKTANKPPLAGEKRYKLTIKEQPVGGVAKALAKNLAREFYFDPRTKDTLEELVSFQVENVTLDELLHALLDPVGLSYEIDDQTLRILPGPPE